MTDELREEMARRPSDAELLTWLENEARNGRTFSVSWFKRQKSSWDDPIGYDIPAGYYVDEESDPQPTLRRAIAHAMWKQLRSTKCDAKKEGLGD